MSLRMILLIVSSMVVSACASSYPPLVSIPQVPPAVGSETVELDQTLARAASLQVTYEAYYLESAQLQDLSQVPLIGAAAFAALILLDNHANAAIHAARVGIAAGTYSAIRGQFSSAGLVDAYIAGHGALTCVLAEGSLFSGTNAQARFDRLDEQLQDIADAINDVSVERYTEPTNAASQAESLRIARTLADQAIAAARTAETAALAQQGAYNEAARYFRAAVASISARVASRGRVRPAVEFNALRDSLAPAKAPSGDQTQGSGSRDVASVIDRLITKTNGLITATARLTAGTPGYSQSLTRVGACPDLIH